LLLFMATDVLADVFKWKKKGDKMALFRKPYKEKWVQETDYIYDAKYTPSISPSDKKKPQWFGYLFGYIQVKTEQGIGIIDEYGREVIPCNYSSLSFEPTCPRYMFLGKNNKGKMNLYYFNDYTEGYKTKVKVLKLEGEYDKITNFQEAECFRLVNDGKIGKVVWNREEEQFDWLIPCEYTKLEIDSTLVLDLRKKDPKWESREFWRYNEFFGKDDKYGWFGPNYIAIPAKYDSTSFTIKQYSGEPTGKKRFLTKVNYIDHNGKGAVYYIMQRDGMRCVLDRDGREIFTHKLRRGGDCGFDFMLNGVGDVYYISADDEKMFFRLLHDSVQVNCRGGLLPKYPFDVMPDKKHTYWLMENEVGAVGLYNSKTDQMILPAEYKAIELPDQLSEVFTVTDKNGVARRAFITHDGASVVQFNNVNDLLKMSKVVKKVGKYQILKYKDAYGIYNTVTKAATALNYTTVKTLGEMKADVNPAFKNFLLTTRGTKKGLVSNDYFFNAMFDQVILTDSAVAVTFKDWYHIYESDSGTRFNVKPQNLPNFIQYLKVRSNGKEFVVNDIPTTTFKYGDDKLLAGEIKTLVFILRDDMIQAQYDLALAGWNVNQGNYNKAISLYTAVKGKLKSEPEIDQIIKSLRELIAEMNEKDRREREQRELERQLAEEQRLQEEYERQRQYATQQRAAEERRQQSLQAWADVAAAAGNAMRGVNNAVQKRYNPQYRQPQVSTNRNYNTQYNQQVGNINANELRDAKKYYNEWAQRAEREMKEYIEADAKLKVPGISQMTRTHEQKRLARARQYLKDVCLKMMRTYRNRAKQLGGNIPMSQTEIKVETLLN
ncbi:MAG: hypothetical protein IKT82_05580, partial [Bacteroidaceae bacterium]|nr:hypothetical protein [Bacteroidaceae bacterium]